MKRCKTHYMDDAVFELPAVIAAARLALEGVDFDTIVGTGFSGGIVIPSLALAMDKYFLLVRKEGDDSHHGGGRLVGSLGERWIFVDDFIATGRTRERVMAKIAYAGTSRFVGQYMYVSRSGIPPKFQPWVDDWAREEVHDEAGS